MAMSAAGTRPYTAQQLVNHSQGLKHWTDVGPNAGTNISNFQHYIKKQGFDVHQTALSGPNKLHELKQMLQYAPVAGEGFSVTANGHLVVDPHGKNSNDYAHAIEIYGVDGKNNVWYNDPLGKSHGHMSWNQFKNDWNSRWDAMDLVQIRNGPDASRVAPNAGQKFNPQNPYPLWHH